MKHFKQLFVLTLMLLVSICHVWGADVVVTLDNIGSGLGSTANTTAATTDITATGTTDSYTLNYYQCKKQGNAMFMTSGQSPFISNHTAMPGNIKSIEVFINTGAAGQTTYDCKFSTTECNSAASGIGAVNITGGNSHTYSNLTGNNINVEGKYFCITLGNAKNGQVLKLVITCEGTGEDVAVTGVSLNKTSTSIEATKKEALEATITPNDATNKNVTWESSNESIATVDENGVVTAVAVGGPVTITCKSAADNTKTATCAVTVTEHVVTPGEYTITFNNALFGTSGLNGTLSGDNLKDYSGFQDDITIDYKKGSSSNMYLKEGEIRLYAGNSLVVTAPTGFVITKVDKLVAGINADKGNINASYVWEGSESSVTFSKTGSGGLALSSFKVTYEAVAPEVTVAPEELSFEAKQNIDVAGKTFTLEGANLTSGLTLAASEGFSVSPTAITADAAMAEGGVVVTVTPTTPTAATTPVEGTVTISGGGLASNVVVNLSMTVTPTYAVNVAVAVQGEEGAQGNTATINGGSGPVYAEYADEVTLVATPTTGYEFVNWTVNTEDIDLGEDATKANGAIATIGAAGTITANFQAQACTGLDAPVLDEVTKTYNSATIAWNAVTNADGYVLNIKKHEGNVAVVTDELITDAVSFEKTGLAANTQYDYSVMAVGDGTAYCDESNPLLEGNFTTNDYPSVAVTYSENNNSVSGGSKKIMTPFALPNEVTNEISGKTFVGWTTKPDFEDGDEAGETYYAAGADFTITSNATVTLYAVYATAGSGAASYVKLTSDAFDANAQYVIGALKSSETHYFYTYSATNANTWGKMTGDLENNTPIVFTISGTANALKIKNSSNHYVKAVSGNFQMSTSEFSLKLNSDGTIHADLSGTDVNLRYNSSGDYGLRFYTSTTGSSAYLYKVEQDVSYSDYVISGSAALPKVATPTFSVASGTLEEETDITISIPDGATVYYTMTDDGTEPAVPTNASTQYTQKITLSDNGTYKFKAIAIKSGCEDSEIATATYTVDKAFTTIEDFIANGSTTDAKKLILTGAVVLGKSGKNIYVQDATGAIILYNNDANSVPAWETGKEISGYVTGKKGTYNDMPEVTACDFSHATATTDGTLPEATVITECTVDNLCKLVKIEGVKFQSTQLTSSAVTVVKGETSYTVYNSFGVLVQMLPNSATSCDVTGVLNKYENAYQISPVSVDGISTGSPKAAAILPTVSDESGEVAKDKVVVVTPQAGMTTTLKIGDAEAQTITTATNVTIDADKSIVVTASAYYYTDAEKTYTYTVNESLTEHNITIDANIENGTVEANKASAAAGTTITLTATPANSHFTLGNWSVTYNDGEEKSIEVTNNQFEMPAYEVNVSATFNEDAYATIVFDGNGATSGSVANGKVYVNEYVTMPANGYIKTNSKFVGWEKDETVYAVGDQTYQVTAEGTITFYAKWDELPDFANGDWTLVESASDVAVGDYVIIASGSVAMSTTQNNNNRGQQSVTINGNMLSYTTAPAIFEVKAGNKANTIAFYDDVNEGYIYAASSGSNYLKTESTLSDNSSWVVSISNKTSIVAQGTNTRNRIFYNSSSSIFSCYEPNTNSQADVVLYKYYTPSYKLTYDKNLDAEVTNLPARQSVDGENKVAVSTMVPLSAEHIFTGWNAQANGQGDVYAAEQVLTLDDNKTIYAQWRDVEYYTISYNADDGTAESPIANEDIKEGTSYTVKANVYEKTGYLFTGWLYNAQTYQAGDQFTPTEDVEFVAQWSAKSMCTVTLYVNGVAQEQTIQVEQGSSYDLNQITAPESINGYDFYGWAVAPETDDVDAINVISEFTPSANETTKSLYAVFKREETGSEKTDVLTAADLAATGSNYTPFSDVQKVSRAKYAGATAKSSENIQLNNNNNPYKGIISTVSGGILKNISVTWGSASKTLDIYASNTAYTEMGDLWDNSKKGTKVTSFTTTGSYNLTDDYSYIGIRSNDGALYLASVSITWQSQVTYYTTAPGVLYNVTYDLAEGAWAENEGCDNAQVKAGQAFSICTNVPVRSGYKFVEWQVGGVAKSGEITISGNTTITAVWAAKASSKLTYNAGTGTGSDVEVNAVEEESEITLPTLGTEEGQINFSKSGYDFKGWKYDGKIYKAGATFIMPAEAATLTAQWKKQNLEKMSLVASADLLVPGMEIVLANKDAAKVNGDIAAEKDFLASVSATFNNDNTVSYANNAGVVTLIVEKVENGWTLRKDASNYLKETNVKELAWVAENQASVWSIAFDEGDAIITAANPLRYNTSSPRFTTYASGQAAIQIYGKTNVISGNGTTNMSDLGNMDNEVVVVSGQGAVLNVNQASDSTSYVAQNGATIKINAENATTKSIVVDETSTIEITQNTQVNEVFHVVARRGQGSNTNPTQSSKITGANKVHVASPGYFDFTLAVTGEAAAAQWHDFSVPFPVSALNGVYGYRNGNWEKLTNEVDYAILDFHGDFRANGAYSWKKYTGELTPGKIYSMTVNGDIETFRFMKTEAEFTLESQSAQYHYYGETVAQDALAATRYGWNGLGNSRLSDVSIGGEIALVYVLVYDEQYPNGGYKAVEAGKINLMIGSAFLIQTLATGDVTFGDPNANPDIYYAPRRAAANEISKVKVTFSDGRYTDNLFLSASEDATNSYEIGKDLLKMFVTNTPVVPTLYTTNYNGIKLASENAPLNGNSVDYALTLHAPKAGEYTVAVEEPTDGTVYLTRNGGIIWNLSNGAYTMDMTQGSDASYGIRIVKAPNATTGCENIDASEAAQKVIIDNNVYILRNKQMYDVTGKAVK